MWSFLIRQGVSLTADMRYRLTVIDEEVPLAAGNLGGDNRFWQITLIVMALITVGVFISIYFFRCHSYVRRIYELSANENISCSPWNVWRLKELTSQIELQIAGLEEEIHKKGKE